ncbi:MAG: UDP-N-acetylmuramoyl-L-alanine--D-glutamate ligase [Clostridia bacterium]|nr:UDP-N-acetylmuramoyl-L-alanine--D-glutamate ligase [Oscillospiraceae bacterium]MBQ7032531.1 UDP-N-acetylmuramoyl-L-alanine--D-glutamate ligase [Clostridia bacterium]
MNSKLEAFKQNMHGKKVVVLGIGISNKPIIQMLLSYGATVTACDKNDELTPELVSLMRMGAKFSLGEKYLDNLDCDMLIRTPGMRPDLPQIQAAKKKGAKITSEMELFFDLCPCKIIGVTGSDGKTTTSTLIYNLLKKEGHTVHLGGNIGTPLLPKIESIEKGQYAVVELSSFQLQTMKKSPNIAVVTNVSPNHLDIHKSMEEYVEAKKNIFLQQTKTGRLILNADNEITAGFAAEAKGNVITFGRESEDANVVLRDGKIYMDGTMVVDTADIILPGMHNVENYMAAIAAVQKIVKPTTVRKVAKSFAGVEHRIEYVREVDGVKFYNDSIASSPTRARAGLYSFEQKVILIAGGYDKRIPFDQFGYDVKDRVKRLYLIGATASKIKDAVVRAYGGKRTMPIFIYPTLEQAVKEAYMGAEAGDIVMLSPACASFDMFKNFEERGKRYKELVRSL